MLNVVQDVVCGYVVCFDDVNGFYLGGNWYGIVFGFYVEDDVEVFLCCLCVIG